MSAAAVKAIPGPNPYTDEWHALRLYDPDRKGREIVFGASDAADICGVGYRTPLEFYLRARGELPTPENDDTAERRKRMGRRMEAVILDEYEAETDCQVDRDLPMFLHSGHWFMGATPDGLAQRSQSPQIWGVDAKNSTSRMFDKSGEDETKYGEEGTDQVPLTALYQAQQQCAVLDLPRVDFPVMFDGFRLKVYSVPRSDELIDTIVDAEKEMAERIINGDPPEPTYRHARTKRLLDEMHGCQVGTVRCLDGNLRVEWLHCEELMIEAKELEASITEIKNRILHAAGDAQFVEFPESAVRLKRVLVPDSIVTEKQVEDLRARIGQVGRKGHVRLQRVKGKA